MYLLNEFGLFGDKKKNNLLPKLGSKLGGIGYGAKRQLQGAKEGFKAGLDLGKKEFKRSGNSKLKNPVRVAAVEGTKLGAKLGKAVGTVEGKIKGYKKGKELQNKLPKFSSTFVVEFAKKKTTKDYAKEAVTGTVVGGGIGATGLTAQHLVTRGIELKQAKEGYKSAKTLYEKGKEYTRKYHPDRVARTFDNEILQKSLENSYKEKFQYGSDAKNLGKKGMETFEPLASKKYTQVIKEDAINTGKRIKAKAGKGISLLKANKGKAALGLGTVIAGAAIINKIRKSRADKGKLRGKYRK